MKNITLELNNFSHAAFELERNFEIARIFNDLAHKAEVGKFDTATRYSLYDINGNKVGYIKVD
jgi:hypothetical protein